MVESWENSVPPRIQRRQARKAAGGKAAGGKAAGLGMILGVVMVVLAVGTGALYFLNAPEGEASGDGEIIHIYGTIYEDGNWYPENITLNVSTDYIFRVHANDTTHQLGISEIGAETGSIAKGSTFDIAVRFDTVGIYSYECTQFCSAEHEFMKGNITVVP